MIILDFETNSSNIHDVIEVAAFKVKKVGDRYEIVDRFHRYYHSQYEVNPHALAVHQLSPEKIETLRDHATYDAYFEDDLDFVDFCKGSQTLVAHNITFELRHLGDLVTFSEHICTMKANKEIVNARNVKGKIKNPKLIETCHFYDIDFDETFYHSAIYDVQKTLDILTVMQQKNRK
ncbi:MAG: 3'-5' exonuclease [Thiovulaceae bacterium]|nr:3'-5' exonuclease [Sulfurimonadaceae bacterium]